MKRLSLFVIACGLCYLAQDWAWTHYDIGNKFESFRHFGFQGSPRRFGFYFLFSWMIQVFYWAMPYVLLLNVFLPKAQPVDRFERTDLVADSERELIRLVESMVQEGWTPVGVIRPTGTKFKASVRRQVKRDKTESSKKVQDVIDKVLKWIVGH